MDPRRDLLASGMIVSLRFAQYGSLFEGGDEVKLKDVYSKLLAAFPNLKKLTASVLKGTSGVTLPCLLLLWAFYMLEAAGASENWGAAPLIGLIVSLAVIPVAAGMITYAAGASWEGRNATMVDAYHLARIRIREIVITGLAAGAIVWLADLLTGMIQLLIGIVPTVLGWIPLIGPVVTAAVAIVFWLISAAAEFFAHTALVMGMLSLTADGVTGRAQAERVLKILRGGWMRMIYELGGVLILWMAVQGACELAFRFAPLSGALLFEIAAAALTTVSMVAVSVVYLQERDRQDGIKFHV